MTEQKKEKKAESAKITAVSETILVVEDTGSQRTIVSHLIKRHNFEVEEAADGRSALAVIETRMKSGKPPYCAVFSDIMMPHMNGIDLLKTLRENDIYKDTPIVLVTAMGDKETVLKAGQFKASGYLVKPVSVQSVYKKLKDLFPNKKFSKAA